VDLDRARATVAKFATVARARSRRSLKDGARLKTYRLVDPRRCSPK
jgi:hypothetical protein